MTAEFREGWFHSHDGLRLYYRDYGDRTGARTPLLCLSGLTRNSNDFHEFALRHAPTRRVICLDYRGRGRSAHDPNPMHYEVPVYLDDIQHLLAVTHIRRVIVVGTSLGGIIAMALGATIPTLLAGVVLNDIGPDVKEDGRQRIAGYVGQAVQVPDWNAAITHLRKGYAAAFPVLDDAGWQRMARGTFTETATGKGLTLAYDLNISVALREQAKQPLPDLWPLFRSLRPLPVLALRGALSDILTADTFIRMKREHAGMIAVTVPDIGHVPMLDEPAAETAIDAFLTDL
ncbi:alpha/beta hydrolase [Ferrovibrio sp.]|uniref:alpha/beta fold hydrolase n=1 Tax=Ferrovibrio sp. TaxID=1917215 RepID=UPI000CC89BF8|nr:alpha/beta hydrolase [Ferrovibrio sp.]PJI37764.1 MAG: alpha/beta hydrolase [Ferrovibrio sp.]